MDVKKTLFIGTPSSCVPKGISWNRIQHFITSKKIKIKTNQRRNMELSMPPSPPRSGDEKPKKQQQQNNDDFPCFSFFFQFKISFQRIREREMKMEICHQGVRSPPPPSLRFFFFDAFPSKVGGSLQSGRGHIRIIGHFDTGLRCFFFFCKKKEFFWSREFHRNSSRNSLFLLFFFTTIQNDKGVNFYFISR